MQSEFAALDAYRLDRDWTWQQLAEDMAAHNVAIPARTLHYLCKRAPKNAKPLDRTLHKIRKFLKLIATSNHRGRPQVSA